MQTDIVQLKKRMRGLQMRRPFRLFRLPPRSLRRWKVIRVVEEGTLSFVVARRGSVEEIIEKKN